ncbi:MULTISPECIES: hypothetical protein [unclassified Arthrobacter]|uniref:hypothetical protein n=1 Tax=unclassified Arthrobacter TaxID=235627 RepID=UPI0006FFC550|nr:hypothetical protein [Arthrobacter sp. Leaf234]KQO01869.1 hypothetical protein ASF21_09935 [Arthrobacter sp. Leaf234]
MTNWAGTRAITPSHLRDLTTHDDVARGQAWKFLERLVAAAVLILLGYRFNLPYGLTIGYVAALALLPVWIRVATAQRAGALVYFLGAVTAISGVLLGVYSSQDHVISPNAGMISLMLLVGILAGAGALLWARTLMRTGWAVTFFGLGMLLHVTPGSESFALNPWKFGFGLPAMVIALGLASLTGRRWAEALALIALCATSALNDSRSAFAILMLTLLAVLWQGRPRSATGKTSSVATVIAVGAMGYVVYAFGQALILDGYLGEDTQERSLRQVETSGSILLGSRPELGATAGLMGDRVLGFGLGAVPTPGDILAAKEGMTRLGYDPNNGYVERYMFGSRFELHSVVGDLWADFGIPGLIFAAVLIGVIIVMFSRLLTDGRASALLVFVVVQSAWNLFFAPLYSAVPTLMLLLGLLLAREDTVRRDRTS